MRAGLQKTLRDRVTVSGVGVHSAAPAQLVLHPADVDSGIVFLRTGLPGGRERLLEAKSVERHAHRALHDARRRFRARASAPSSIFSPPCPGCRSTTSSSKSTRPKRRSWTARRPISSARSTGRACVQQPRARRHLKILKPVRIERDGGYAEFLPADRGFRLDVEIDFESPAIGRQRCAFNLDPVTFRRDIARARTFGFVQRRQEAVGGGLRARLLAGEFHRHRGRRRHQSRRSALCGRVRPPQGARCDRRSLAGGSPDRRSLSHLSSRPQD